MRTQRVASIALTQRRRGAEARRHRNEKDEAQTLTYLRLLDLKLGIVINFGKPLVSDGIRRVVNGL